MAEKYIVYHQGVKVIWEGMAETEEEAKACAVMVHPEIPVEEMTGEFQMPGEVGVNDLISETKPTVAANANNPKPARKPRKDAGVKRGAWGQWKSQLSRSRRSARYGPEDSILS